MNIVRSWREQKVMMKRRFPVLNDEDFSENEDRETIMKKLQVKLNKTEMELRAIFAELQLY